MLASQLTAVHDGFVNKFIGDAALALFGVAQDRSPAPADALRAAAVIADELESAHPALGFGIRVTTGEGIAGRVGGTLRFEYTLIGEVVNRAEHLQELTRHIDHHVVCDVATAACSDLAHPIGAHVLRRSTGAVLVFAVDR